MPLLGLIDDILLIVLEYLNVQEILLIRQTCTRLRALTRLRSVWLTACARHVLAVRLPFPRGRIDDLSAVELERRTRRALRLKAAWAAPKPEPRRVLSFQGGPLNGLLDVRFVLRPGHEWIVTLCEGIWPKLVCWDLQRVGERGPTKVGEWSCMGATIRDVVVNSDMTNDACLVISVVQNGRQRLEVQAIQPVPGNSRVTFDTLKTLQTAYKPVALDGDILAISNEHTETRIVNWRSEHYAILQSTEETEDETLHDRCLQVLVAHASILVARARSVDLFPMADLHPPHGAAAPASRPVATYSFGWIDGIALAPVSERTAYPYPPLAILIRAESGDPWASDIHSLNRHILLPNPDFAPPSSSAPYVFPPALADKIPATRGFLRCAELALGAGGSALWIRPRPRDAAEAFLAPTQMLCGAVFPGPLNGEGRVAESVISGGVRTFEVYSDWAPRPATWTALDYVESRGCIALGAVDGRVTVLFMA
ncbi:hypothetical protein DFH11DRAFT_1703463 [Phellopilus nigrolimitatus]|nr:hypothetical protein DFH11DRAFT_1703463 [Phellopilus nigrolimitatus]